MIVFSYCRKDKTRSVDKRAESVVYVSGTDTQALFNYLLNCKSCIATTGNLAGIPPTLLAPTGFTGATLKRLQVWNIMLLNGKYSVPFNKGFCIVQKSPIPLTLAMPMVTTS